jgi:kynureninase
MPLALARARDAADPLAAFRGAFSLPATADGAPALYLCGHSLGPMPLAARERVTEELEDWARLGVAGHHVSRRPWIDYADRACGGLARLAGAQPADVVAMNSLTANLHLLMASFYRPSAVRTRVLIESGAFSSDRHAVASQIAWHGLDPEQELVEVEPREPGAVLGEDDVEAAILAAGDRLALVLWPGVQYLSVRCAASTTRTPLATCRFPSSATARISPCGAATSTSTRGPGPSAAHSSTRGIRPAAAHCGSPAGGVTSRPRASRCVPASCRRRVLRAGP